MAGSDSPNPLRVAFAVMRAMRRRRPTPSGTGTADHRALGPILDTLATGGVPSLGSLRGDLAAYRKELETIDPDRLSRREALAYWLNLYNAGALDLAAEASARADTTVLRVPGAFSRTWARIAEEKLSLDEIEHAKLRRFGDPRIHGALVCGSASCPTLRYEPYRGEDIDAQLDDQMASFLRHGGAHVDTTNRVLSLSRIFLWFGSDFVRPGRMPTWLPSSKRTTYGAVSRWLDPEVRAWVLEEGAAIAFQPYDWSLACAIR